MKPQSKNVKDLFENKQNGLAIPVIVISLVVICIMASYTFDYGRALFEQRKLQFATDAAAMAASIALAEKATNDGKVEAEAGAIAQANGVNASIDTMEVKCGAWIDGEFIPCRKSGPKPVCRKCADSGADAVRVSANRTVFSSFARVIGVDSLIPPAVSIAIKKSNDCYNCIKPFGIEDVDSDSPLAGVKPGDIFYLGTNGEGNWGKLDIGENMSSGKNFWAAMLGDYCIEEGEVEEGDVVSTGTGFGGPISKVFEQMFAVGKNLDLIFAVNTAFGNGNSEVTIKRFVRTDYLGYNLTNGNNWEGIFRLKEDPADFTSSGEDSSVGGTLVR